MNHYRAIFLSDVHLATRGCQAELLLDFLRHNDAERYYLVGDIVDLWRLKRRVHWPQPHNDVIQKLLRKARKGASIIYLPGNHDDALRGYIGTHFGGVEVMEETMHATADGRRFLILHGDKYDGIVRHHRWLAVLGESAYHLTFFVNHWLNLLRRLLGLGYWSLSAHLKQRVKNAVVFITNFMTTAALDARRRGYDGIICGHIHHAETRTIEGVEYWNAGDWVENCTALVEHSDGRLEIINWSARLGDALDGKAA